MPNQKYPTPVAIFDTLENLAEQKRPPVSPLPCSAKDYKTAVEFLKQNNGSKATFNAYRREIERLLMVMANS